MSKSDYSVIMRPGLRVRVEKVWPQDELPYEGTIKTWNSNGDIIEVLDSDGEVRRFGPIEALSYWDQEKKVFVHQAMASHRFDVLDQEDG